MTSALGSRITTRRDIERVAVVVLAGIAAVAAILADGAPTGTERWDQLLRAALAVVIVLSASRGPRWIAIVFAAVAAGAVGLSAWVIPAWAALIIAISPIVLPRRSRLLAALSSAIAVQVLLRLPAFGFFGLPSLVAGAACGLVIALGYKRSKRNERRQARWILGIVAVLTLIAGAVAGFTLLSVRADVEQGISAARRGLVAARAGDSEAVVAELDLADGLLASASDRVNSPLMQPMRLVPVVAQHYRALGLATEQGALVASEAAQTVRVADLQLVSLEDGRVDLQALTAMAPRLRSTADVLAEVPAKLESASSPWLLPIVRERVEELTNEVTRLEPEAELAAQAAVMVPALLGADAERTYLVLFGTPAESREFGGFVGSWALVRITDGKLVIERAERIGALYELASSNEFVAADDLPPWYEDMARPTTYPQNLTSSPDLGTVAQVAHQVLAGIADRPVDGYLYMDTWAVVQMLAFTGPVAVDEGGDLLNQAEVARLLFVDQYRLERTDRANVFDDLARVADAAIGRAGSLTLPGPESLGEVLGPIARAGRMQMVTFDDAENDFLRSVRLLRDFDIGTAQDFVGFVQTNSVESKLDLYLFRDATYDIAVAPDGSLTGVATMELRSVIPDDAPPVTLGPDGGAARPLLSLYTPHGVSEVRIDGAAVPFGTAVEYGFQRVLVEVLVPPTGATVTVEYEVFGRVDPTIPYDVKVWHQPLVNNDQISVSYAGPAGEFDHSIELVENMIFSTDGAAQE